jgi:hypothetical protein
MFTSVWTAPSDRDLYIPMLYSNSSSIESTFALFRAANKGSCDSLAFNALKPCIQLIDQQKALNRMSSNGYDHNDSYGGNAVKCSKPKLQKFPNFKQTEVQRNEANRERYATFMSKLCRPSAVATDLACYNIQGAVTDITVEVLTMVKELSTASIGRSTHAITRYFHTPYLLTFIPV